MMMESGGATEKLRSARSKGPGGQHDKSFLQARRMMFPYLLLAPALIIIGIFIILPICQAIFMSFYDIKLTTSGHSRFIGLSNYVEMLTAQEFWRAFGVTIIYVGGSVVGSYLIGLATALIINMPIAGRKVIRLIVLLPWAMPQVVVSMMWMLMYDYQYGVVNYLLRFVHLIEKNINWLGDASGTLPLLAVLAPTIWNQYPIATLMLLAGLLSIPEELYEAAEVDGASALQKFYHITWPALRPVTTVIILLFTIWGFKRFDLIYLMTQGGPLQATETIIVQTYLQAFQYWNIGYAAALGGFSLIVSLLFAITFLALARRKGEEAV
jgi:multiple sugar transport system permease protein